VVSSGFIDLNALPGAEALALFSRIVGADRAAAEPQAALEIVAACGGLPLAVRICAARLAARGRWPVAAMAARLRDERRRLDELRVGDLEVRASFRVSYETLDAACARVFRLLGLWPGQRISLPAAAALAGEPEADAAVALEALADANLLQSPEPDWYQLHDLLRLFAAEQARAEETGEARDAAARRLLQWYLRTAAAAADALSPYRYRIPGEPPPHAAASDLACGTLAWYDRELGNMIAAIRQAAADGLHDAAWRLATTLVPPSHRRATWAECVTASRLAVDSARAADNRQGQAWALHNLGQALFEMGEAEAFARLAEALAIRRETGDLTGQAQTLISLADAHGKLNGPQQGYDQYRRHMDVLRRTGLPPYLAAALNNHGEFCLDLGKLDEAAQCLREALGIFADIGGHERVHVMDNLGRVHLRSGQLTEAIGALTEAHRLYQATGHLEEEAQALTHLGEAQHRAGLDTQARESLTAAIALFEDLRADREVKAVQATLASIGNLP
jgi:tetratricopeptide (TPR) repeat protein